MRNAAQHARPRRRNPLDWPSRFDWQDKLSDFCNPVLVRDLQQSLNGQAIARTSALASLVILILLILYIKATGEASHLGLNGDHLASHARDTFTWTWICLLPVLWFILPVQAFLSMRVEAGGSAAEHLALCDLSPWKILSGKMLTGVILSGLYLGICTPLLAVTTAMRGVDPATFGLALFLAILVEAILTSWALAAAMLTRVPGLQNGALALVAVATGATTLLAIQASDQIILLLEAAARASAPSLLVWSSLIAAFSIGTASLIATSTLSHRHENRATSLRVLGLLGPLSAAAIISFGPHSLATQTLAPSPVTVLLINAAFWFTAITEEKHMSPRVISRLPRSWGMRVILLPFLPGRGRGILYALLSIVSISAVCWIRLPESEHESTTLWILYLFILVTTSPLLRAYYEHKNPRNANWRCRGGALVLILTASFVGWTYNAARGTAINEWNAAQYFNPFAAIDAAQIHGLTGPHIIALISTSTIAGLFCLPFIIEGIREVLSKTPSTESRDTENLKTENPAFGVAKDEEMR